MPQSEIWKQCRPFDRLGQSAIERIAALAKPRKWADGETLFLRGEPGDYLVVIVEGCIRLGLVTPQGQTLLIRQVGPGEMLGELAMLDDRPRSTDATALGDTTALVLTRSDFERLAQDFPELMGVFARYLAGLLRDTNDRLENISLYRLKARVARYLLAQIAREVGSELPKTVTLRLDLGQGDLALLLGASRPKVNRVLQDMIAADVLARAGLELRCDVAGLQTLAEPEERLV